MDNSLSYRYIIFE